MFCHDGSKRQQNVAFVISVRLHDWSTDPVHNLGGCPVHNVQWKVVVEVAVHGNWERAVAKPRWGLSYWKRVWKRDCRLNGHYTSNLFPASNPNLNSLRPSAIYALAELQSTKKYGRNYSIRAERADSNGKLARDKPHIRPQYYWRRKHDYLRQYK